MAEKSLLTFGSYVIDGDNAQLRRDHQPLRLTNKAFAVLRYLLEHAGQLVTKEAMFAAVWPETVVSETTLTNCIGELRRALSDDPKQPQFIETVHRRGYRFIAPLSTTPPVSGSTFQVPRSQSKQQVFRETVNLKPETVLVGREAELAQLHHLFAKALNGERQIAFVTGEAGIGKTALVDAFRHSLGSSVQRLASEQDKEQKSQGKSQNSQTLDSRPQTLGAEVWVAWGQCIEQYGTGEAYLPVLEALGRLGRESQRERLLMVLQQYAPTWLAQLPALLSPAEREVMQRQVQGATRERMLREIAEALDAMSNKQPVVLVLEDLHWSDPSTVELLTMLARRREPTRLFVLGTYRAAELAVSSHPLKTVKHELVSRRHASEVALSYLSPAAVRQYVNQRLADHETPDTLADVVYQRTDGQPLFMVQVTEYVAHQLNTSVLMTAEAHALVIPQGLHELLEAQLGRLTEDEQNVLTVSSVVGTEFTAVNVAAGLSVAEARVETVCERLARRGQFIEARGVRTWPDGAMSACYGFRHALYHEVLYARIPEARRVRLHLAIGERIERGYGERTQEVAAELAMHFERGHELHRAVLYLKTAADNALRRHAYTEAIELLTHALGVLQAWPDTPARVQQELALQVALGTPLLLTKGQASLEVERTYNRARELCQQVGDTPQLFHVLLGLWRFYSNRAQYQIANEVAEQFLSRAQSGQDPVRLSHAHAMQAQTWFLLGDFIQAKSHAEQGLALYDSQQHRSQLAVYGIDAKIFCLSHESHILWMLGYPDQALQCSQDMLAWSQELGHAFNIVLAYERAATCHFLRREMQAVHERVEAGMPLAREHRFAAREAYGKMLQGWRLAQHDQCDEGIALIRDSITAFRATGAELLQTYFLALLAEAYDQGRRPEDGLQVIAKALTLVDTTGERLYEAELWRLKGELLFNAECGMQNDERKTQKEQRGSSLLHRSSFIVHHSEEAEACFLKAIDVARRQYAKSLELRAIMSLVRLRQHQALEQGAGSAEHGETSQELGVSSKEQREKRQVPEAEIARGDAHSMLSEVYGWFTEGFETKDLQEAKALLESLRV